MKNFLIVAVIFALGIAAIGCRSKQDTGRAYMPDMYYSRAFETYGYNDVNSEYENLKKRGITYNAMPVSGTMARGDAEPYPFPNTDSGYKMSAAYHTAFDSVRLKPDEMKEAE